MKAQILKEVDNYLFSSTVENLKKIYAEAVSINKGVFDYSFFNRGLLPSASHIRISSIPSEETLTYIKPYIEMYEPIIERRELIQCYLLQFMNQSEVTTHVTWLLPEPILEHVQKELGEPSFVRNLVATPLVMTFMKKPEYEMIQAQQVFLTMGL